MSGQGIPTKAKELPCHTKIHLDPTNSGWLSL
jgi:hypothetical protein